jgi:hypothetical protein
MASGAQDYTKMMVGTKIDGGEVTVCPYCGRCGLKVFVNDVAFYNHRLGSLLAGDTVQVIDDSCPQNATQKKEHEAAQPK